MRVIKIILLVFILLVVIVLSLANRDLVTVELMPAGPASIYQASVQLPLFVVGLLCILTGLILGYILEWLREYKHRKRASQKTREAAALNREVGRLRKETGRGEDDVIALIGN